MNPSEFFVISSINSMLCRIILITVIIVTYQNICSVLRGLLLLLFLRESEFVSLLKRGLVEGFAQLEQRLDLSFDLADDLLADLTGLFHLVVGGLRVCK